MGEYLLKMKLSDLAMLILSLKKIKSIIIIIIWSKAFLGFPRGSWQYAAQADRVADTPATSRTVIVHSAFALDLYISMKMY